MAKPVLRIVAPSGVFDRDAFDAGLAWLRQGWEPRFTDALFAQAGYLAGNDTTRLQDLRSALADPEAKAILAVRGGYGATRLLPSLDPAEIAAAGVPIVGFSDITALHALWHRAGVASWHAPMAAWLGKAGAPLREHWTSSLQGSPQHLCGTLLHPASLPEAAPAIGGNLAVLHALAGTPFLPNANGHWVLLEDIGEAPYRIDRMVTTLLQNGFFDGCVGILLGTFEGCKGRPGPQCPPTEDATYGVLLERLGPLGFPIIGHLPIGHGETNLPLPFGIPLEVEASGNLASLRFGPANDPR